MSNKEKDPWHRNRKIRDGICEAIYSEMCTNDRIYLLGEGAHMKVHFDAPKIEKKFPKRVVTLPISEDGNGNMAVGMALAGLIPIVDVISSDFLFRAMDSICNTMAKLGTVQEPRTIIVKAEFLTGGPTSGQRIEAMFTHVPGLTVAIPSTPMDAYHMMQKALGSKEITLLFEDRMIKDEWFDKDPVNSCEYSTETPGLTTVSYGITYVLAHRALKGKKFDLFDIQTLYPLNLDRVLESLGRTKKLLIVEPSAVFMGIGAEIAAQASEKIPGCKIRRLGGPRRTIPASRDLHKKMMPTEADILLAYEEMTK